MPGVGALKASDEAPKEKQVERKATDALRGMLSGKDISWHTDELIELRRRLMVERSKLVYEARKLDRLLNNRNLQSTAEEDD